MTERKIQSNTMNPVWWEYGSFLYCSLYFPDFFLFPKKEPRKERRKEQTNKPRDEITFQRSYKQ